MSAIRSRRSRVRRSAAAHPTGLATSTTALVLVILKKCHVQFDAEDAAVVLAWVASVTSMLAPGGPRL